MTDKRELRRRLEALIRGPSPRPHVGSGAEQDDASKGAARNSAAGASAGKPGEIVYRRDLPRVSPAPAPPADDAPPVAFDEAVCGSEVCGDAGRAFVIEQRVAEMPGGWGGLCESFAEAAVAPDAALRRHLLDASGEAVGCEDLLFLDLETTGLGNLPVFLIGTMVWEGGGFLVRQYFARDYSEERAILSLYSRAAAERKVLVSFNGKSFDVPFLRVRAAGNAVACAVPPYHLDLLHVARRTWRGGLPDCRLQTLERFICKRVRSGDLGGEQIPEAYHAFVRTGNAAQMVECLRHNRLDLLTLADLMTRLPPPGSA